MDGDSHAEVLHRLREVEESIDCVRYDHSRLTVENFYLQERIRKAENPTCFKDRVLEDPFIPNDWQLCPPYKRVDVCELNTISTNYAQHVLARLKILENNAEHMRHQVALLLQSNTDMRVRIAQLETNTNTQCKSLPPTNKGYLSWLQATLEQKMTSIAHQEVQVAICSWESTQKKTTRTTPEAWKRLQQLEDAFNNLFPPISASQLGEGLPPKRTTEPCQQGTTLEFRVGQLEQAFHSLFPPLSGTQDEKDVNNGSKQAPVTHETPPTHLHLEERLSTLERQILLGSDGGGHPPILVNVEKQIETRLKATLDQNLCDLVRKAELTVIMRAINSRIHHLVVHPNLKARIEQLESVFLATMMGDEDSMTAKGKPSSEKTCTEDCGVRHIEEEAPQQEGEEKKNPLSPIRITLFAHNGPMTEGGFRSKRKFSACHTANTKKNTDSKSSKFKSNGTQNTNNEQPVVTAAPRTVKNPYAKK